MELLINEVLKFAKWPVFELPRIIFNVLSYSGLIVWVTNNLNIQKCQILDCLGLVITAAHCILWSVDYVCWCETEGEVVCSKGTFDWIGQSKLMDKINGTRIGMVFILRLGRQYSNHNSLKVISRWKKLNVLIWLFVAMLG